MPAAAQPQSADRETSGFAAAAATAVPAASRTESMAMVKEMDEQADAASGPAPQQAPAGPPGAPGPAGSAGEGSGSVRAQAGRQLIVEAWMSLEVGDIDSTARQVEAMAAQWGGWVESADVVGEAGYRAASLNIRVPAGRFNNAMEALRNLGRVTDEGVSSTDVTDQLIDNEARMQAWQTQEERLIILLENAATVEDVIDIERRISEVRADIERVAATQRNLENRVAASLIRVNLHLPQRFAADPPHGSLVLAVGDPSGTADTVTGRVESLKGYVGEKREYQEGRGQVVELSAFVRSTDLASLMDYASTLGEPSERRLTSVGPAPAGDVPNARLTLVIRSNVDSAASLALSASEPSGVAWEIRNRAESLGGYVESWSESRWDEGDRENIHMELVVRASDLREIMDYGATLGEAENWEFHSIGQGPADAAPNSRLTVSVYTEDGPADAWVYIVAIIAGIVVIALVAIVVVVIARRRGRSQAATPPVAEVAEEP